MKSPAAALTGCGSATGAVRRRRAARRRRPRRCDRRCAAPARGRSALRRAPRTGYRFTEYFEKEVLRKRPYLRKEWCVQVLEMPLRSEPRENDRFRFWGEIPELEGRYLRVVTLAECSTARDSNNRRKLHTSRRSSSEIGATLKPRPPPASTNPIPASRLRTSRSVLAPTPYCWCKRPMRSGVPGGCTPPMMSCLILR